MESDYISLRLFLLSSLNDFCLFVTVLLVSSFFGFNFCPTFSVRVSASFYNSGFEKLLFILKEYNLSCVNFFFFLMIEIWFCGGLQESEHPEKV